MKIVCQNCTAPLEVERGCAFARCEYCGHTNKVKSAQTLMAEQPRVVVAPPVVARPSPRSPRRPAPTPSGAFSIAGCIPLVLASTGILFAAYQVLSATGAMDQLTDLAGPTPEPMLGVLDLDLPLGRPRAGVTTGVRDAMRLGNGCRGYIPRAPHVVLRTSSQGTVQLDVTDSREDLVLAVERADGTWQCDDDGGAGTLPRLRIPLTAGDHRVYVGTFSEGATSSFSLVTTWNRVDSPRIAGGLSPGATPSLGQVRLDPGHWPSGTWSGTTAGWTRARELGPRCRGGVPAAPHLRVSAVGGEPVRFETRDNTTDLTMVVRAPSGAILCDDDSGEGLNPRIDTVLEAGETAVWVGVFNDRETAHFTLEMSGEGDGAGLRPDATPVLGESNLDIAPPEPVEGRPRQDLDAADLAPHCRGWVGAAPDLNLITTIPRGVTITAEGRDDLTLVLRGPSGALRCDDDGGQGRAPQLTETLTPGVTHVWVGGVRRRARRDFELRVEPAP